MSAVDKYRKRVTWAYLCVPVALAACSLRSRRPDADRVPVAAPTLTPPVQTPAGQPDGRSLDVPFDGSKPEALGTAAPANAEPQPAAEPLKESPAGSGKVFDVYAMLQGAAPACDGEKQ
jgi:hypothetical protein